LLFEHIDLWKRTLAPTTNDEFETARARLRVALLKMRTNAGELVKLIPSDCKELTVHDVTHLDALWEMADLIAGKTFNVNPAEAFVFGAAVLIHDAGMSIASYPKGIKELKATTEWRDIAFAICRRIGVEPDEAFVNEPRAIAESW
jgi:hypothetical protein